MKPPRPRIVPISRPSVSPQLPSTKGSTAEGTELARAYDRAMHWPTVDRGPDSFGELADAVRAFVLARRAVESPPERVLATIKSVLRPGAVPRLDEARGDRLQALILREFLTSYYGATTSAPPASGAIE